MLFFFSFLSLIAQKQQQLFYYFDFEDVKLSIYLKDNGIQKVLFIDEHAFATGTYFGFNEQKLRKSVEELYPDPLATGFCYIDLEAPYIDELVNEPSDTETFKRSLSYYLQILRSVKKLRPNVKWGYYGIPFTTYWNLDESDWFVENIQKIESLIIESDVLFPSMYFFYSDEESNGFQNDTYVKQNIENLIKISAKYNKMLLPFVMERFHPSNRKLGLQKIPEQQFLRHIRNMLEVTVEQRRIDGIVWWNADKYFYNNKTTKNIGYSKDVKRFLQDNSRSHLKLMKKILVLLK
ncbi:hypothetical protein [Sphingobacterium faecale]|uniref:Hyaluronidase n=1 Tax=Sphingobacterium faecale TaxID=2803775 RepID=A0ABS1R6Z8_9SPHI|nr:hypothetical protein [Sphingobacterium faecale]MBL1410339.1 hypothetical protein [Sphingobacterium faecale]